MDICPACLNKSLGKLSYTKYFCHSCFIEIHQGKGKVKLFKLDDDGTAVKIIFNNKSAVAAG